MDTDIITVTGTDIMMATGMVIMVVDGVVIIITTALTITPITMVTGAVEFLLQAELPETPGVSHSLRNMKTISLANAIPLQGFLLNPLSETVTPNPALPPQAPGLPGLLTEPLLKTASGIHQAIQHAILEVFIIPMSLAQIHDFQAAETPGLLLPAQQEILAMFTLLPNRKVTETAARVVLVHR